MQRSGRVLRCLASPALNFPEEALGSRSQVGRQAEAFSGGQSNSSADATGAADHVRSPGEQSSGPCHGTVLDFPCSVLESCDQTAELAWPRGPLALHAGVAFQSPGVGQPLSTEALAYLSRLPPGHVVYSSAFPSLSVALSSWPGWVDLFSGSRGLAKALAEATPWWVLCFDICHDAEEDVAALETQQTICEVFRLGAACGFSADPPAGSFSSSLVPAWRDRLHPEGVPGPRLDGSAAGQSPERERHVEFKSLQRSGPSLPGWSWR